MLIADWRNNGFIIGPGSAPAFVPFPFLSRSLRVARNGYSHSDVRALLPDTTTDILPCRTWRGLPLLGCPGLVQDTFEITQLVMPIVLSRHGLLESARA